MMMKILMMILKEDLQGALSECQCSLLRIAGLS